MSEQIWTSLLSGLFGSLIGGLVTYLVTKYLLQETVKNSLMLELTRKETDREQQLQTAHRSFIVETEENLESIKRWRESRANFRFSREAWTVYKSNVPLLSEDVQKQLIKTYAFIGRYNTIIDYDVNINSGSGALDRQKERRIEETEKELIVLKGTLISNK